MVTIPRHFITSWDIDLGDSSVGFDFTGFSLISYTDTSRIEVQCTVSISMYSYL